MTPAEAISIISRQAPCPHANAQTDMGDGKTWARCDDCGREFPQASWDQARHRAKLFDAAIRTLEKPAPGRYGLCRMTYTDDHGTYSVEVVDTETLPDIIIAVVRPLLLAAGFGLETVNRYLPLDENMDISPGEVASE